jgi:release factor glutamine methyltransferase
VIGEVEPSTLAACLASAVRRLEAAGFPAEAGRRDAEILARAALGWTAADWLSRQRERPTGAFRERFESAIGRRCRREPVAYITGEREFYGRVFRVTSDVLIPRPETELVVEEALAVIGAGSRQSDRYALVDVGTGSGCLAVTLALECPAATVTATDLSAAALDVAGDNASRLGASVNFRHVALIGDEPERYDLVVSNPPYVSERERFTLMPDVRDYEPPQALFGGADGLEVIRALVPAAERALRPGGWLILEIGEGQSAAVQSICETTGRLSVRRVSPDLAGVPRVVVARRN